MTCRLLDEWNEVAGRLANLSIAAAAHPELAEKLGAIAERTLKLADDHPDAALAAVLRMDACHYASAHALHVAIFAALLSRRIGWGAVQRGVVVRAALAMNLAMVDLQMTLQTQREPLSESQRREINTHPQRAYQLLFDRGVADQAWLEAVRLHHEPIPLATGAVDSPNGATMAQLLRVLDIFCAKISRRSYRRALAPAQAARELMAHEAQRCAPLVKVLIEEIGLYLPGSAVRLASGDIAVVRARGCHAQVPQVVTIPNLAVCDTSQPELAVAALLPDDAVVTDFGGIWLG